MDCLKTPEFLTSIQFAREKPAWIAEECQDSPACLLGLRRDDRSGKSMWTWEQMLLQFPDHKRIFARRGPVCCPATPIPHRPLPRSLKLPVRHSRGYRLSESRIEP